MTGPDRIWAFDYDLQDDDGTWRNWQCWSDSNPKPLHATEYVRRDTAVLAALPEVQALIASAYEAAAEYVEHLSTGHADELRALTPADAKAAQARRDAQMMAKGMRMAAEVYAKNELIRMAAWDRLRSWRHAVYDAILARAAEVEKDGGAG